MPANFRNTRARSLIATAILLIAIPVSARPVSAVESASATDSRAKTRIKWQCTEHSATRVVVDAEGRLASETQPARTTKPVQLHAIKLDPTTTGAEIPARVISTDRELAAPAAAWSPGNSVTTRDGRLRLDLTDNEAFLASPQLGNQALFRRFSCQTAGENAPIHYQCGPDFDLWVAFTKASDAPANAAGTVDSPSKRPQGSLSDRDRSDTDRSDTERSDTERSDTDSPGTGQDQAAIQYPGGSITLPRSRSGSGARYAKGDTSLWIKGDSATFTLEGDEPHTCQVDD